jgi:hypothetical protein
MAISDSQHPRIPNEEASVCPRVAIPASRFDLEQTLARLRSLHEGDPQEQRETWEFLRKALDEDRPAGRKLFPEE